MRTPDRGDATSFAAVSRLACRATWLVFAAIVLVGCRREGLPAAVEGKLTLRGKPLDNCLVTFLPETGQEVRGSYSTGLTDEQGCYRLSGVDQREGAAVGPHRVTVQDMSVSTGVRRRDHGTVDAEPRHDGSPPKVRRSRVSERYSSPASTPLRFEVRIGPQTLDLELE